MPNARRAGAFAGPFPLFAGLSLAAVVAGCLVARQSGTPSAEWARNLAAWALGALLAGALARLAGPRVLLAFLVAAPLVLALSFLNSGQDGVHRWVQLGPLRMNVAEVLLPAAVVALTALSSTRRLPWAVSALALILLVAQPDASQATALGGALMVLLLKSGEGRGVRAIGIVFVLAAILLGWLRHDPLAPVPDVEGIMRLARALSLAVDIFAGAALAGAMFAPLAGRRLERRASAHAGLALAAYGLLTMLAPLAGAFPVPLVGMGMSPILGLWLGVGLLASLRRAEP